MKKNLLLLDDDKELCEEFFDIFKAEGYHVDMAHDGLAGKKMLETTIFDILILDIKIPILNGFFILKWLKEINYQIHILVLTGRPLNKAGQIKDIDNDEEILLEFADSVVNKPSCIEDLIEIVNNFS